MCEFLDENPLGILLQDGVPFGSPDDFDHIPSGSPEFSFQLLDDLSIAANRPIEALQIAVDYKDEVVQFLPGCERECCQGFGLVRFTIAHEDPDFPVAIVLQAPSLHVFHEACLIDCHGRSKAHGDRRELPEFGHQIGMGIGRESLALRFLSEMLKLVFSKPSLYECAGIHTRR
ncbi:hypothetical protein DSECCO2_382990 [anaerobic digester metagenome]